jgi:hypothetical protein
VLADFESAKIDDRIKITLRFLKKLTLAHGEVKKEDVRPMLDAGISKQAIGDAIYVCYLFSVYTRLADALGWDVPPDPAFFKGVAKRLINHGYE